MKLSHSYTTPQQRQEQGSAVIVVIVLLAIMMIYIAANLKTLHALRTELKLIEARQVLRVQGRDVGSAPTKPMVTNSAPSTLTPEQGQQK